MSWGKGWEVGVRKAQWSHQRAMERAAEILAQEHGTNHVAGTRTDLCWKCQQEARLEQAGPSGARGPQ